MQDGYHRIPDDPHTLWGIDMSYITWYSGQTICHLTARLPSMQLLLAMMPALQAKSAAPCHWGGKLISLQPYL